MTGGEPSSTADVGRAILAIPETNQALLNILRDLANKMDANPRWGTWRSISSVATPWPAGFGGNQYGILEHKAMNGGQGKDGELTVSLFKVVVASGTGSRGGSSTAAVAGEEATTWVRVNPSDL